MMNDFDRDNFKTPKTTECIAFSEGEIAWKEGQDGDRIALSERNFARFLEVLDDPEPPTPALMEAMQIYRQLKKAFPQNNL